MLAIPVSSAISRLALAYNSQQKMNRRLVLVGLCCAIVGAAANLRAQVPANAHALGPDWYCNNGFKRVGNECVSIFATSGDTVNSRGTNQATIDTPFSQTSPPRAERGRPNLAGVPAPDRTMIESACRGARVLRGPAVYYSCVEDQLAALRRLVTRPDLAGVPAADRTMIESACRGARVLRGPAVY